MTDAPWLIAQTNINCELRAMRGLRDRRFEVWQPTLVREVRVGPHARKPNACKRFPVLGGLLLVRHEYRWPEIRDVDGIRGIVMAGDGPALAPHHGARGVQAWRNSLKPMLMPMVDDVFRIGQQVVITDGPFLTFSAVVERLLGKSGVEVALHVFGRSTRLQIDRAQLEAVA